MPSPVKVLYTVTNLPRFVFTNLHLATFVLGHWLEKYAMDDVMLSFFDPMQYGLQSWYWERNVGLDIAKA